MLSNSSDAYRRPQAGELLHRLREPRRCIQVLAGPRQIDKTTPVQQTAEVYSGALRYASAVQVLGEETLRGIARELVETVRRNVTIDWTLRENVRAQLRVLVKRILRKHGYPPDKQEQATQTVLEQAEILSQEWVAG